MLKISNLCVSVEDKRAAVQRPGGLGDLGRSNHADHCPVETPPFHDLDRTAAIARAARLDTEGLL